jgi:hypothetical protein
MLCLTASIVKKDVVVENYTGTLERKNTTGLSGKRLI